MARVSVDGRERLLDEYKVGDVLGDGAFGVVYSCTKRTSSEEFAVKMVDKVEVPLESIRGEADLLASIDHPNVVKFHRVFYEKVFVCIVMDLYRGGDVVEGMISYRSEKGRIHAVSVAHICRQMVEAIAFLHALGMVHRDVKGDNYLMDRKDLTDPMCRVVLSDFGTARRVKKDERMTEECGTLLFWSPEFYDKSYGVKVDVWAIGVIMYGVLDGRFPFKNEREIRQKQVMLPKGTDPRCTGLIRGMLEKKEATRIGAAEALEFEWLRGASSPVGQLPKIPKAEKASVFFRCGLLSCCSASISEGGNFIPDPDSAEELVNGIGASAGEDAVEKDGAGAAAAERRRSLVERLEDHHQKLDAAGAPSMQAFRNNTFTIQDNRGGMAFRFEWWPQEQVAAAGLNNVLGGKSEGDALREASDSAGRKAQTETVAHMLVEHGIRVDDFGKGDAKTLEHLAAEVQRGASRLLLDACENKKLVRVVDLVLLRISTGEPGSASNRLMVELSEKNPDGRERSFTKLPGTKKEPEENTRAAAGRVLRTLDMGSLEGAMNFRNIAVFEQREDSPSFPGLTTVYRKELVECNVSSADAAALARVGLPGGTSWSYTDGAGRVVTFGWHTEEECRAKGIELPEPGKRNEEISGLVQAPVGISETELQLVLERSKVDISRFGRDRNRSLREFCAELQTGESSLVEKEDGELLRIVDVALLRLTNAKGEQLVATDQIFPDGYTKSLNFLPGTKRRPDDNQFHTAWRYLKKKLKIDETLVTLDPSSVIIAEEEKLSDKYPGINTKYRKRIISATLDA